MRHGVWSFSKLLEAWPKLPQYGAAYLVMNAMSMALTIQCLCNRTVIYGCCMSGLDKEEGQMQGLKIWLSLALANSNHLSFL